MTKAYGNRFVFGVGGKARLCQRGFDDRRKVTVIDMHYVRPGDQSAGEDAGFVAVAGLLNAVGRHQNRAGEGFEFFLLILPGAAVVACQMGILFQAGIGVAREHFAVRIDVDSLAFCLLEQFFEVFQVVAGDKNRLAFPGRDTNDGRLGVAVGLCVGLVEQFHHL